MVKKQVQQLLKSNKDLIAEQSKIEKYLKDKDIKTEDHDKYLNNSLIELLIQDIKDSIAGIIGLVIIGAILSFFGLGIVVAIFLGLAILAFIIIFFKQIFIFALIQLGIFFLYDEHLLSQDEFLMITISFTVVFLLYLRYSVNSKRKRNIETLYYIENMLDYNDQQIIRLSQQPILSVIHNEGMADVASLHAKGFSYLPTSYINNILNKEVEQGKLEKIYLAQKNINLYKSKTSPISNDNMTTIEFEID